MPTERPGRAWRADLAWTALLTAVVLGPLLLGRGYWLVGDMVFVPEQPWKDAWLGLDGALPRAVPMDALVSVLTQVVPGWVVQRVLLVGALVLGGLGAGRLVRGHAWYARAAAITFLLWNPWVHERLEMGQWAILAGYLALPWVALAARRLRDDVRTGWAPAALALVASAVCSPSSGVTAVAVLAVLALRWRRAAWRTWAVVAGLALAANLPWLVPSLLARGGDAGTGAVISTGDVFGAFAARAESGAGLLPSLLSFGGTWKTSIVAGERASVVIVLMSCGLTVAALAGLRERAVRARGENRRLLALAAGALLVAALPALPGGLAALEWLGDRVPATAILRDSHRYLAPAVLAVVVGLAGAVTWLRRQVAPGREAVWAVVGLVVVAPVVLLPSLAWGGLGDLRGSTYPPGWSRVADRLDDDDVVVVLPWRGATRGFDWTHGRAVLDPAPRFLPGTVLVDDRLYVNDVVVPAEDPRVTAVGEALEDDDPAAALARLGVTHVLVEGEPAAGGTVPEGAAEVAADGLLLLRLTPSGGPVRTPTPPRGHTPLVIAGDGVTAVLLGGAAVWFLYLGSVDRHITRRSARGLWEGTEL